MREHDAPCRVCNRAAHDDTDGTHLPIHEGCRSELKRTFELARQQDRVQRAKQSRKEA